MYKLLIIDDDELIREGIKNAIEWDQQGISEVKTAGNGEAGWQIFQEFEPDIILTDIRMPVMDGIDLLKRIRQVRRNAKVIILSGYDDFSYAQTAVKEGAFDYLLKTADIDELLNVISKAKAELDREKHEAETYRKLKEQLNMSLPLLKYRYLNELIYGCTDINQLIKRMEFVDIHIKSDCFMVAVLVIDDFDLRLDEITEEERLLYKLKIINIMEEYSKDDGICFESKNEEFIYLYMCNKDLSIRENKEILCSRCEEICRTLGRIMDFKFSVGLSNIGYGLDSVRNCFSEAKKALDHRLFYVDSIVDIQDINPYTSASFNLDFETENRLISALRVGNKNEALGIIEDIFSRMRHNRNLEIGNFHQVCIELLSIASRVLCEFDAGMDNVFGKDFLYFEEIRKYKSSEDAIKWMVDIFNTLLNYILNTKILKAKKIVETVKRYIDEHYNENLSLNMLADMVHISPNYFSYLFSNTVGQSFMEYVMTKRIEKAKQLLGDTDSRACEVGEKVGYDNPNYFSRIFKKYTGLSPSQYKESLKSNE